MQSSKDPGSHLMRGALHTHEPSQEADPAPPSGGTLQQGPPGPVERWTPNSTRLLGSPQASRFCGSLLHTLQRLCHFKAEDP